MLVVNESYLVMTIRCEAGEPLTQTEGDAKSDTRFTFTRNIETKHISSSKSRTKIILSAMTTKNPIQYYRFQLISI